MNCKLTSRVLIIGGDHHNTLAVVRCLGRRKVDILVVVHTQQRELKKIDLSCSRYTKGRIEIVSEREEEILNLLNLHKQDGCKQIIFPCSDFAAYIIDKNSEALSKYYILPGFKENPGYIVYLMDKMHQKMFANQYKIPMAKTWSVKTVDGNFLIPEDMVYPCIVKPEMSVNGNKADITISQNRDELQCALKEFSKKQYTELVIQEFLKKQYEACAFGVLLDSSPYCSGGIIKKINEFPPQGGGSLSFAQFTDDKILQMRVHEVLEILYKKGYRGAYDIEFFVCDNEIYLNEMNFRHSGNGYALIQNKVYAPFYWCIDAAGLPLSNNWKYIAESGKYNMDEILHLRLLKRKIISKQEFLQALLKTNAFARIDIRDLCGTYGFFRKLISESLYKMCNR